MNGRIVAVVGVCEPERRAYAAAVARIDGALLLRPSTRAAAAPALQAAQGVTTGAVVELTTDADVVHTPGLDDVELICVVDARHFIDDLRSGVPLDDHAAAGDDRGDVGARARNAVSFLENATVVVMVGWESVETARLSSAMAVASHLNPAARVRLSRGARDDLAALPVAERRRPLLDRPGWLHALDGTHDPYMTDARVTTVRYEQLRPFHPGRLVRVLDAHVDGGRCGAVLRSAGLCRLATRPGILARWEQVGSAMWIDPLPGDVHGAGLGTTSQDIALTGLDIDAHELTAALDSAALTDRELAVGPRVWRRFADPLPHWPAVAQAADT